MTEVVVLLLIVLCSLWLGVISAAMLSSMISQRLPDDLNEQAEALKKSRKEKTDE